MDVVILVFVIGCCLAQLIEDQQMLDSDDETGMVIQIIIFKSSFSILRSGLVRCTYVHPYGIGLIVNLIMMLQLNCFIDLKLCKINL